ncbi:MAG: hypothetical protein FWC40_05605 [Proteobacteria bacterium]|nr:hypothetical protein [Pseudomonadota bacterium]
MKSKQTPPTSPNLTLVAKRVQDDYLAGRFEAVMHHIHDVRRLAKAVGQDAIYLTSFLWEIQARKNLGNFENIVELSENYVLESRRLSSVKHHFQACRLTAQIHYDQGQPALGVAFLEEACEVERRLGQDVAELGVAMAQFELEACLLESALKRVEAWLPDTEDVNPSSHLGMRMRGDIFDKMGEAEEADRWYDRYFFLAETFGQDLHEQVLAMDYLAKKDKRAGRAMAAHEKRLTILEKLQTQNDAERDVRIAAARLDVSQALWDLGKYPEALAEIHKTLTMVCGPDGRPLESVPVRLAAAIDLTLLQYALETGHPILSPEDCFHRIQKTMPPERMPPDMHVAWTLMNLIHAFEHGETSEMHQRLDHQIEICRFRALGAALAQVYAFGAVFALSQDDHVLAQHWMEHAREGFVRAKDAISLARLNAMTLELRPEDEHLSFDLLSQAQRFFTLGHKDIALTLFLALARAAHRCDSPAQCRAMLELAAPLIVPNFMARKEMRFLQLCATHWPEKSNAVRFEAIVKLNGYVLKGILV